MERWNILELQLVVKLAFGTIVKMVVCFTKFPESILAMFLSWKVRWMHLQYFLAEALPNQRFRSFLWNVQHIVIGSFAVWEVPLEEVLFIG